MIPYRTGNRAFWQKDVDAIQRQQSTDIQRLWRYMGEGNLSDGTPVGNDPSGVPAGAFPGGSAGGLSAMQIHMGVTTAAYTKSGSFNRLTNPGSITAKEDTYDAAGASTTPRNMTQQSTVLTIYIRSKIEVIPSGAIIYWIENDRGDGTTEKHLVWADCDA